MGKTSSFPTPVKRAKVAPRYSILPTNYPTSLTDEETYALTRMYAETGSEEAMERLLAGQDKLVSHFIRKFYGTYISAHFNDLQQEGRMAIIQHSVGFDPSKGTYSTYIYRHILHALNTYICEVQNITIHQQLQIKKFRAAKEKFAAMGIDNPTIAQLADEMHCKFRAVQAVVNDYNKRNPFSLDNESCLVDVQDGYVAMPDEIAQRRIDYENLHASINMLEENEQRIIKALYFSTKDGRDRSVREVATAFGIQEYEVKRVRAKAFARLRSNTDLKAVHAVNNKPVYPNVAAEEISFYVSSAAVEEEIDDILSLIDD